jgi:cell wall integrity and stress response component
MHLLFCYFGGKAKKKRSQLGQLSNHTANSFRQTTAPTTTTAPPTNPSPVLSVQTISGQATTITVVGSGSDSATATPSPAVHSGSSGLSGGAIAGIVIGTLLGVAALAALGLWFWFVGRRRQPEPAPSPDSRYDDPSVQNGLLGNRRQSKASQMSLMPNFFPGDQEKPPVSPTSGGPAAFIDNRMKKDAALYPHGSRHSTVSLRDDQDYTRPVLRVSLLISMAEL